MKKNLVYGKALRLIYICILSTSIQVFSITNPQLDQVSQLGKIIQYKNLKIRGSMEGAMMQFNERRSLLSLLIIKKMNLQKVFLYNNEKNEILINSKLNQLNILVE
ncbi:unnamed protein product [Paramecium octaurelia]|uniref:Uncharacterized protein n=1 Tax=Paramecium octaurelia TaxID=43137 RepID=A0A8S1SHL8_PAROT|nr:unnamed protein product [Paramecium octaurelia]